MRYTPARASGRSRHTTVFKYHTIRPVIWLAEYFLCDASPEGDSVLGDGRKVLGLHPPSDFDQRFRRTGIAWVRSATIGRALASSTSAGFHIRYCSSRYARIPVSRSLNKNSTPCSMLRM